MGENKQYDINSDINRRHCYAESLCHVTLNAVYILSKTHFNKSKWSFTQKKTQKTIRIGLGLFSLELAIAKAKQKTSQHLKSTSDQIVSFRHVGHCPCTPGGMFST